MTKFYLLGFSKLLILLSMGLFVFSLTQESYCAGSAEGCWNGWWSLVIGWMGLFAGNATWFANPLLVASWIAFFTKSKVFYILCSALVAVAIAASFLLYEKIVINEAGHFAPIEYRIGYWVWLGSMICQVGVGLVTLHIRKYHLFADEI